VFGRRWVIASSNWTGSPVCSARRLLVDGRFGPTADAMVARRASSSYFGMVVAQSM
jgi:hypothetical protein